MGSDWTLGGSGDDGAGEPRQRSEALGDAITQDLDEYDRDEPAAGTLYAVIPRLEQRGLIEASPPEDRRRPYRITAAGAQALETEATQMRQLADLGLRRLSARPGLA